ncbi:hypothetical protein [Parapedobacter sp.]|uniref:hypothetical protein n=1 Tax=Parapedobacter sp. TaxID=1958893 RepID=UPI002D7F0CE3|nr:hypothetical protein [Parapedobacter sp.]
MRFIELINNLDRFRRQVGFSSAIDQQIIQINDARTWNFDDDLVVRSSSRISVIYEMSENYRYRKKGNATVWPLKHDTVDTDCSRVLI